MSLFRDGVSSLLGGPIKRPHALPPIDGQPNKPEPPRSKDLQRLTSELEKIKEAAAVQRSILEQEIQAKQREQERLSTLERAYDDAADALAVADAQFASDKAKMAGLESDLVAMWSKPHNMRNPETRINSYNGLAILRLAVSDFPRVRSILAQQLADAEIALQNFKASISE